MSFFSPLRYPGGKSKLSKFIDKICVDNEIDGHYVEPYAGGACVALFLLMTGRVKEVTINDLDRAIYSFWFSVIHHTDELCELIDKTNINPNEWYTQRNIVKNKATESDVVKLGYATLFMNRTNFSGVIDGGMIGGSKQEGEYKLDCRFNKDGIIKKIRDISKYADQIHITNLDAVSLINQLKLDGNMIFYFDPPYYIKGPSLYMNHYNRDDHILVSKAITSIKNAKWVVSYDDTEEIQILYDGLKKIDYSLNHSVRSSRVGRESIFFSSNLAVDVHIHPITLLASL